MKHKQFLVKGVEVLKTGKHTDANGRASEVDVALLNELAESYDPDLHLAPVTFGHSSYEDDSKPTDGLIRKAYVDGESLFMDLILPESTMSAIETGRYPHRSIGFYERQSPFSPHKGKAYVQHLALLGKTPPAIKGLKPMIKVYSEMTTKTFAEANLMDEEQTTTAPAEPAVQETDDSQQILDDNAGEWVRLLLTEGSKGFKGEIVTLEPEPSADNQWLYDSDAQAFKGVFVDEDDLRYDFDITKSGEGWTRSYKQQMPAEELVSQETEVEMAAEVEVVSPETEETELAQMRKQMAEMRAELAEHKQKQYSQTAEKLYSEGKLTEGIVPKAELVALFQRLDSNATGVFAFSETNKSTALEFVQGMLERLPAVVTFGEMAKQGEGKKGVVKDAEPIKPMYTENDEAASKQYAEIVAYCEAKGYDMKKRGMFEKAMREMAR